MFSTSLIILVIIGFIGIFFGFKKFKKYYDSTSREFNFTFTGFLLVSAYQLLLYQNTFWNEEIWFTSYHFFTSTLKLQIFLVVPMFLLILKANSNSTLIRNRKVHYIVVSIFGGMLSHHYDSIILEKMKTNTEQEREIFAQANIWSVALWCGIILTVHLTVYIEAIFKSIGGEEDA